MQKAIWATHPYNATQSGSYVVVYEYQQQRSTFDTIPTNILDYGTFGLGTYMISPMDRFEGTKNLIAITQVWDLQADFSHNSG